FTEIEAQSAFELPERETPVKVTITCAGIAVCIGKIVLDVDAKDVVDLCAQVVSINVLGKQAFTCKF
ncbi:MAG: hypothetical protein ACREA4_08700, partial [Nitrososphaera sp.]